MSVVRKEGLKFTIETPADCLNISSQFLLYLSPDSMMLTLLALSVKLLVIFAGCFIPDLMAFCCLSFCSLCYLLFNSLLFAIYLIISKPEVPPP